MAAPLHHVCVLGAGVCGLAAALELLRSGAAERVTLLEAEDRPGGMARSVYDPSGLQTDFGPHRIHTEIPEIDALLRELADDALIWVERRSAMLVEGRLVDYPFSIRGVLGLYGPIEFTRMGLSAAWAKVSALWRPRPRDFEEHMRRAFGARVYERVLKPYSQKVWKTDPREISVKAAEVRVSAGSMAKLARRIVTGGREKAGQETALKRFRYLEGGVETLVKRLAAKVTDLGGVIECDRRVEALISEGEGQWRLRHSHGEIEANAVISTIPVTRLPPMLSGMGKVSVPSADLDALEYLGIGLVFLFIRRPQVTPNHWLYFPDEDLCFNRGYEPRHFWVDPKAPPDRTLLSLEVTARHDTALWALDDDALARRVSEDLCRTDLISEGEIEKSLVARLPCGYPLYDKHSDAHLRTIFDHLRRWPGLISTGRQGLFSHNNMDHSMHMGLEAARALVGGPEAIERWYDRADALRHQRIVD